MNSLSFQEVFVGGSAVLSITGTERSWREILGTVEGAERALWHITAARFPPADEPPIAAFERSMFSNDGPKVLSQRRASQESCTAAG